MNQLNVSLQHSITNLAANGWSHRRIARELDIHHETVGRHLRLAGSKPAKVLTGSEPVLEPKPAIPLAGSLARLQSRFFHPDIDLGVTVGRFQTHVSQPDSYDVHFQPGFQKARRSMSESMG